MANQTSIGYIGKRLDLLIRQGGTFGPYLCAMRNSDGTPVDLTGCAFRGHIRKTAADPAIVCVVTAVVVGLATEGNYSLGISATDSALIQAGATLADALSKYVWDLEMVDSLGRVIPIYYGDVNVFREVTRA